MEQQTLQAKRDQNDQTQERYTACLLGGAIGDALGAAVEFMSRAEILSRFGPAGITDPTVAKAR